MKRQKGQKAHRTVPRSGSNSLVTAPPSWFQSDIALISPAAQRLKLGDGYGGRVAVPPRSARDVYLVMATCSLAHFVAVPTATARNTPGNRVNNTMIRLYSGNIRQRIFPVPGIW